MNFSSVSYASITLNCVLKPQAGHAVIHLSCGDAAYAEARTFANSLGMMTWLQFAWWKPGFEDHAALLPQVSAKAAEGPFNARERFHIADGAEKAEHDIVQRAQTEVAHVGLNKSSRGVLILRDSNEFRIDVQTVHGEPVLGGQQVGMLPGATANVEKSVVRWIDGSQQLCDLCTLKLIVFEARVDEVVKFCGFRKHADGCLT